jgi:sulfotransferase family protein
MIQAKSVKPKKKKPLLTPEIKDKARSTWLIHPYRLVRDSYWKSRDYLLDQMAVVQPKLTFKLLCTAIPKSGTHLIMETLGKIRQIKRAPLLLGPRVPFDQFREPLERMPLNRYAYGHLGVNEHTEALVRDLDLSVMVMLRDPRDVVVSHVDHAYRLKPSILRKFYGTLPNDQERLKAAIRGVPADGYPRDERVAAMRGYDMLSGYADIGTVCRGYLAWQKLPGVRVHVVHYRDLIGEHGGGTRERQFETVRGIVEFLKLDVSDKEIERICGKTYNTGSATFNQGTQNRWKSVFDSELKELFKEYASRELIEMGYEKDDNW